MNKTQLRHTSTAYLKRRLRDLAAEAERRKRHDLVMLASMSAMFPSGHAADLVDDHIEEACGLSEDATDYFGDEYYAIKAELDRRIAKGDEDGPDAERDA